MSFEVIPAIDLRGGNVVRLTRGDYAKETIYHPDPPELAASFASAGVKRLHVVDLDGARSGKPVHADVIHAMSRASGIQIEIGGGIRTMASAEAYLESDTPAQWVILGTAALKDPTFVLACCERWPERVIVGIDARKGRVAVEGWLETSEATPLEMAQQFASAGVAGIIYTDISRDGTGDGPNIEATAELALKSGVPIIASGGVANTQHIEDLSHHYQDGVVGVVVGRAILSGEMPIASALNAVA